MRKPRAYDRAPRERGVALISALALLAVFVIVTTTFLFAITLQERTSVSYRDVHRAQEVSLAGAEIVAAVFQEEFQGPDGIPYSGDETTPYDSLLSPSMLGLHGNLRRDLRYDARRWVRVPFRGPSLAPQLAEADDLLDPKWYMPRGVDEDGPGDMSAEMGLDEIMGAGAAPGIPLFDDDGDGLIDEDGLGVSKWKDIATATLNPEFNPAYNFDDDEDGYIDEDPGLRWVDPQLFPNDPFAGLGWVRDTTMPGGPNRPGHTRDNYGIDDDNDAVGVFDECARVNINVHGNLAQRYHEGATTYELDMVLLPLALGIEEAEAVRLVDNLVRYRIGPDDASGLAGYDDDNNDQPLMGFNNTDDSGDSVIDSEGELYIADAREVGIEYLVSDPDADDANKETNWVPGDGIDNDGDGLVDEDQASDEEGRPEGIDNFEEFDIVDDAWFDSVDRLRLVEGFRAQDPMLLEYVDNWPTDLGPLPNLTYMKHVLTTTSKSPQISTALPFTKNRNGTVQARLRYNPNLVNAYTPAQVRKNLNYLLPLQVDSDGDWNVFTDDWDGNRIPSGDFDLEPEDDMPLGGGLPPNDIDDDRDGVPDDDGNSARIYMSGTIPVVDYDPEWHVNEDPWGDQTFLEDGEGYGVPGYKDYDDDGDGEADEEDLQVKAAMEDPEIDGVDNDNNGLVDEPGEVYLPAFDDDEDGKWDEDPPEFAWLLNLAAAIGQPRYLDSGLGRLPMHVYEPVELTMSAFHGIGQLRRPLLPPQTPNATTTPVPVDVDFEIPDDLYPVNRELVDFRGALPVRINEVLAMPVLVLRAAEADFELLDGDAEGLGRDQVDYRGGEGVTYANRSGIFDSAWEQSYEDAFDNRSSDPDPGFLPLVPANDENPTQVDTERTQRVYYQVRNHPSTTYTTPSNETLPRDRDPEHAVWTFDRVPNGEYLAVFRVGRGDHLPVRPNENNQDVWVNVTLDGTSAVTGGGLTESAFNVDDADASPSREYYMRGERLLLGDPVVVEDEQLAVEVFVPEDYGGDFSFDSVELYAINAQYVELVNIGDRAVNLQGWAIGIDRAWPALDTSDPDAYELAVIRDSLIVPADDPTTPAAENVVVLYPPGDADNEFVDDVEYVGTFEDYSDTYDEAAADGQTAVNLYDLTVRDNSGPPMRFVALDKNTLQLSDSFWLSLHAPPPDGDLEAERGAWPEVERVYVDTTVAGLGFLGFLACEKRDPTEARIVPMLADDPDPARDKRTLVRMESPWGALYARNALREGDLFEPRYGGNDEDQVRNRMSVSDANAVIPGPGAFQRDPGEDDTYTSFTWPGSARSFPPAIYAVRVIGGRSGYVGEFGIAEVREQEEDASGDPPLNPVLDLREDGILPPIDIQGTNNSDELPFVRLDLSPPRPEWDRIKAPLASGGVAFLWDNTLQDQDLTLALWQTETDDGHLDDVEAIFDRVELSKVISREHPRVGGTPGRHNLMYAPVLDYDVAAALPLRKDYLNPDTGQAVADALTDLQAQQLFGLRGGRLPSPGYLLRTPTGEPWQRVDLTKVEDWFRLLTAQPDRSANVRGAINVNTAPFEVLVTLPFAPLRYDGITTQTDPPTETNTVRPSLAAMHAIQDRFHFNSVVARTIMLARQRKGLDGAYGVAGRDDDGNGFVDDPVEYKWPRSDDGPFEDTGDLMRALVSAELADALIDAVDNDGQTVDVVGVFWPQYRDLPEDDLRARIQAEMQVAFARVANIATVHSGVISVVARGRVVELNAEPGVPPEQQILAERVVEVVIDRTP